MKTTPLSVRHLQVLILTLAAFCCLRPAAADPRTVSFHLGAQCLCAQCGFDAQRALSKMGGVQKATLSVKQRRLDVTLDESRRPVSALAVALSKMELGKDSALLWSLDANADTAQAAKALGQTPGVKGARPDAKAHAVLLTFAPSPSVTMEQLDAALKGAKPHA